MPPAPVSRAPLWARIGPRVAGAWILTGCLLKALLGTPGDLPAVLRDLPLALGTTFKLALGLEAFTGLFLLLRPGRAWPLGVLLLLAFSAVLVSQVAAGAASCGCFGETLKVPPWLMLAVDLALLALLLAARPWRLAHGGRLDLLVLLVALAAGSALPFLTDREVRAGEQAKPGDYAILSVKAWLGKPLKDTDLGKLLDLRDAPDGVWLLYRLSCHVCAECIETLALHETGAREVAFVRIGEPAEDRANPAVHDLPDRPYMRTYELPDDRRYAVGAPARLIVEGGVVVDVVEGIAAKDCGGP